MLKYKIVIPVLTALLGLGVAGAMTPQDADDDAPATPKKHAEKTKPAPKKKEREKKEREKDAEKAQADPVVDLRETYAILRRLRSDRGATIGERPREWTERASRLYRVGVQAYQEGDLPQARAYSAAARDLARAIELTGRAVLSEQADDDDLPPPPPVGVPVDRVRKRLADVPDLPPLLDDDDLPALPRAARGRLAPLAPRAPAAAPAPRAGAAPRATTAVPPTPAEPGNDAERRIRRLEEELDQLQKRLDEAKANPDQKKSLWQYQARLQNLNSVSQARADLRRAYERIREARSENRSPESRFYLDAARDLYNAARRDAEAGRNDRASELARAAEALTLVPSHLADLPPGAGPLPGRPPAMLRVPRGPVNLPNRPGSTLRDRKGPEPDGEKPKPAEPRSDTSRPDDLQAENAGEKPFAGIGVALAVEDGKTFVQEILPGSSADRDGRLQVGDRIVAVATDEGKSIDLDDKELGEIAQLIRGPAGSKIRIVVIPKGSDEQKRYTLTRQPIDLGQLDLKEGVPPAELRRRDADRDEDKDRDKGQDRPRSEAKPAPSREGAELPPFLPD